jgi:hypothetical protein
MARLSDAAADRRRYLPAYANVLILDRHLRAGAGDRKMTPVAVRYDLPVGGNVDHRPRAVRFGPNSTAAFSQ